MVKEALAERSNLIEIAPHLSYPFPIMLPVYKLWQIPYYWVGIKAYRFSRRKSTAQTKLLHHQIESFGAVSNAEEGQTLRSFGLL